MTVRFRLSDPRQLLALGLGAGLVPRAPGTAGTVAAIPLVWAMSGLPLSLYLGLTLAAFVFGCWICGVTARAVGVHDHPSIVWDEVVGLLITCIAVPATAFNLTMAFLLFRIFDVIKPWPISVLDRRLTGGFGIMLDDALAAVFALALLHSLLAVLAGLSVG